MFTGFLVSPAVLSMSMMLYGLNGLWGVHPREWLKNRWWLWGIAWIAFYAITYFWSSDKGSWELGLQIKLPFLLLPLAFSFTPRFSARQNLIMTFGIGVLLLGGIGYSLSFLIRDPQQYLSGYSVSHLLPTPSRGDHICFSVAIALYIVWSVYYWPSLPGATVKWCMAAVIAIMVLYIHVLAAKSGIISFYLFMVAWGFYLAYSKHRLYGILVLIAIPLFIEAGLRFIPTFHDRKAYTYFSVMMLKFGDRSGNYGDIGRIWSYTISWKLMKEHPVTGVGVGDLLDDMKKGYDRWHPEVVEENRLIPHNQFLIVGLSAGIPAMLVFGIWAFMPLTWLKRNRTSFFLFATWLVLMFYLVIDTGLEVQMGVFIYLVFTLLMQKQLPSRNEEQSVAT